MSSSMFGCSVNSLVCWYAIIGQTKSCIDGYTRILQRRARRHATINVVDFSDVTRCQNMVDVSDRSWPVKLQYRTWMFNLCYYKHVLAYDNVSEQARKGFLCLWCDGGTDGQKSVRALLRCRYWTSNYVDLLSPHVGLVRLYCTHTCVCTVLMTEVHRILEVEATWDFL
jgi:hypothetical protein